MKVWFLKGQGKAEVSGRKAIVRTLKRWKTEKAKTDGGKVEDCLIKLYIGRVFRQVEKKSIK